MAKHRRTEEEPSAGEVVETTKTVRRSKVKEKNPYPALIRSYLSGNIDFTDELASLRYKIDAQRITVGGMRSMVRGRTFEDLENIGNHLGELYGTSSWKLFIKAYDATGEKVAFETVDNFAIEWAGEEPAEIEEEETQVGTIALQMQREKQEHELRLKQLEFQNQREIELIKASMNGNNSLKLGPVFSILKQGINLGRGMDPGEGGGGVDEESVGGILKPLVEAFGRGLGETLASKLKLPDGQPGPEQPGGPEGGP